MADTNNHNSNPNEEEEKGEWQTVPTTASKNKDRQRRRTEAHTQTSSDDTQDMMLDLKGTLPWISFVPPNAKNTQFQPVMIILCGIPGSGKSTFSKALQYAMPYKFVRVNQDDLGTRRLCEEHARLALQEGKCPVIDRCNFDAKQRENFIRIACDEFQAPVDCIVFETESSLVTVDECIQRCTDRKGHPTIKPGEARGVVMGMAKQMKPPKLIGNKEGIRVVQYITSKQRFNDALVECMNKTQ